MINNHGGSGWLLNPSPTTVLPINNSVNLISSAGIQQAANSLFHRVLTSSSSNHSSVSFDQWFFTGSESADIYILGAFLLFMFLCLILSLPVFFLICNRSRTSANAILFHYYLSNWIFLLAQLMRFARAQQSKMACPRLSQMGPWFYMDILSTPISYIALALLAVERFVFHVGHTFPPLRWLRSTTVLTLTLLACWLLLAGLDVGIFLLLRMLSLSDFLRPVVATLGASNNFESDCANPLAGSILSPVRDILTALFVCTIALPAIGSALMQIILHCITCRSSRQLVFQRSSLLAFGIIFSHLGMSLPHVTLGIFVPYQYRALAWMLTIRALQSVFAIIMFLVLDNAAYTLIFTYLLRKKPPPLSSTMNRTGDIDTLIASVDVTQKLPSGQMDMGDGMGQDHLSQNHQTAQHPYLAIRPARLYFERPQSAFGMDNHPNNGGRSTGTNRSMLYNRNHTISHNESPVSFPQQGLISPRPPPLPPRRLATGTGRLPRQNGASSSMGNSRSLPPTRRRFARRHESHHDLGAHSRMGSSNMSGTALDSTHRPAHRLYQSDYRLSLCDERMITVDNSRSSPGGWFECVITNEEEV